MNHEKFPIFLIVRNSQHLSSIPTFYEIFFPDRHQRDSTAHMPSTIHPSDGLNKVQPTENSPISWLFTCKTTNNFIQKSFTDKMDYIFHLYVV